MAEQGERFMRIMVFFDLPTLTKADRKRANEFRRFLIKDGYIMIQLSVYCRVCKGIDTVEKHRKRLDFHVPDKGSVRLLTVTEKQYASMVLLTGTAKRSELTIESFLNL